MRAGFGKWELTPPLGVELTGYGYYLNRCAETLRDPLYARAVMFEQDDVRTVIISCELLGLSRAISDAVRAQLPRYGAEHMLLVSVHTHTGPSVKYHEGCGCVDDAYAATVADRILHAVELAAADLAPVQTLTHMCEPFPGDYIYNRADPNGPVDRTVRGFTLTREGKAPIAMVSLACHCVFRGRSTAVSADLAGAVNQLMEQQGFEALFLNGLCGDIDPWKPSDERLDECAAQVARIFGSSAQPLPLTLQTGTIPFTLQLVPLTREDIEAIAQDAVKRNGGPEVPAAHVALVWRDELLSRFDTLSPQEPITVSYLLLGGVPVIALPFEGFTIIGQTIRQMIGRPDALTLGCAEELLGYLPTREDISRGSYAALAATFLYKRLPVVPGEAERLGEAMGSALQQVLA